VKTEQLVSLLATRVDAIDPTAAARRCRWALATGSVVALAVTGGTLHFNPALSHYLSLPMFWVREVYCAALAVIAFFAVARLARPGIRLGWVRSAIIMPVLAMWVLAGVGLLAAPPQAQMRMILGDTAAKCPFLIALLSVPLLAAYVWVLRGLAPTQLRLAGAAAGFAAGSIGALMYSLHCPELAAPFIGIWYLLGMLIPATIGAVFGPRLLRW
jgi:hypothetical protein